MAFRDAPGNARLRLGRRSREKSGGLTESQRLSAREAAKPLCALYQGAKPLWALYRGGAKPLCALYLSAWYLVHVLWALYFVRLSHHDFSG